MEAPDVKARLVTLGAQLTPADSAAFGAQIRNEYEKSSALAKKLGNIR
jgi:tripartite-type tricarboxylate transporter receptor subunit TctC